MVFPLLLHQIINKELVGNKKPFKSSFLLLHLDDFTKRLPEKQRLNEFQRGKKDISYELINVIIGTIKSIKVFLDSGINVIFEGTYGNLIHQLIRKTFSFEDI